MKQLFVLVLCSALFIHDSFAGCTLPVPSGVKAQNVASCQFDLKWKQVNGAANYTVRYKLASGGGWVVLSDVGNVSSYTISGLTSNTGYKAQVAAVCVNDTASAYSASISVTTTSCSQPTGVAVSAISNSSAVVSWSVPCGEGNFKLKYRIGSGPWITQTNIASMFYTLDNLTANTTYTVKVQSICDNNNHSIFSKAVNFTTLASGQTVSSKNVLLVIIDDARFDSYMANNGPSFFGDTNISRIADEGVNFKLTFPAQSQCAPSRASIITGTYPHINGVIHNPQDGASDTITIPTLAEILHAHGYYCGLVGKYHVSKWPQPGFDFWMEQHKSDYIDTRYNLNGHDKAIPGHVTDVVSDSAIGFLKKVPPGKPFFLWLGYRAPHTPYTQRPEDSGLYDNDVMPVPQQPNPYDQNYPGFLYDCHSAPDSAKLATDWRGYYGLLHGVEANLGRVYHTLDSLGIMDSTLVIFMSDNGYIMGEHGLFEKQLAYEGSIKLPLFMRYPKLFKAGKVIKKEMAMNIDIAPTILDFAGIPDTVGMQGISLLKLYSGDTTRTEFFYEFHNQKCTPDMRAIRSLNAKYITYNCDQSTEEFYDLNESKNENINEIYNPAYADSVQLYRDKLAYWRNYFQDYSYDTLYSCSLSNIVMKQNLVSETPITILNVFPNPAADHLTVHLISESKAATVIRMVNVMGVVVFETSDNVDRAEVEQSINTMGWPAGNYFIDVAHGGSVYRKQVTIQ